jgi:hypothetical protein
MGTNVTDVTEVAHAEVGNSKCKRQASYNEAEKKRAQKDGVQRIIDLH